MSHQNYDALFSAPLKVELHVAIHPVHFLVVPSLAILTHAREAFPETPAGTLLDDFVQSVNHWHILTNTFNLQKDLYYSSNPNGTEEDFYAQPEIRKYTKEYQDQIVKMGEDKFQQYQYKVEFTKENKYLIVNTDYKMPDDGSRILTQKYGGMENCYVSYVGMVNLSGIRQLVANCEGSRSYHTTGMTTFPLGKILQFAVVAFAIFLFVKIIF